MKISANSDKHPFHGVRQPGLREPLQRILGLHRLHMSALEHEDFAALLGGSRKISCSESGALPIGNLTAMLSGVLLYQGFTMNFSSEYQSSYNGTPCTYLAGTMERGSAQPANGILAHASRTNTIFPLPWPQPWITGQAL